MCSPFTSTPTWETLALLSGRVDLVILFSLLRVPPGSGWCSHLEQAERRASEAWLLLLCSAGHSLGLAGSRCGLGLGRAEGSLGAAQVRAEGRRGITQPTRRPEAACSAPEELQNAASPSREMVPWVPTSVLGQAQPEKSGTEAETHGTDVLLLPASNPVLLTQRQLLLPGGPLAKSLSQLVRCH